MPATLLAAIGAALVILVASGLVILSWNALSLDRDSRARWFVATECLAVEGAGRDTFDKINAAIGWQPAPQPGSADASTPGALTQNRAPAVPPQSTPPVIPSGPVARSAM